VSYYVKWCLDRIVIIHITFIVYLKGQEIILLVVP